MPDDELMTLKEDQESEMEDEEEANLDELCEIESKICSCISKAVVFRYYFCFH